MDLLFQFFFITGCIAIVDVDDTAVLVNQVSLGNSGKVEGISHFIFIAQEDGVLPTFGLYHGVVEFDKIDVLVSADGAAFVSVKSTEGDAVRIPGDEAHDEGLGDEDGGYVGRVQANR